MSAFTRESDSADGGTLNVQGKRFYAPRVLLLYSILANFPIAIFLYGINVHRRGATAGGNIIKAIAAAMIALITSIAVAGTHVSALPLILIGIAIGVALMQAERSHFERCIAQGALREKWWPPLFFLAAQSIIVLLMAGS